MLPNSSQYDRLWSSMLEIWVTDYDITTLELQRNLETPADHLSEP